MQPGEEFRNWVNPVGCRGGAAGQGGTHIFTPRGREAPPRPALTAGSVSRHPIRPVSAGVQCRATGLFDRPPIPVAGIDDSETGGADAGRVTPAW